MHKLLLLSTVLVACTTQPEYKREGHVEGIEDCCWDWVWWGDYAVEQCMVEVLEYAVDTGGAMPGQCQRLECGWLIGDFTVCEGDNG